VTTIERSRVAAPLHEVLAYPDDPSHRPEIRPGTVRIDAVAPSISVVIPTLNEAGNLRSVLGDLPLEYEVVVVDGHSTDDTVQVARALRPDAHIIHQTGLGKGDALADGFRVASGDVVVTLDADCSAVTSEIPRFVEALVSGADFAKGSRYLVGGGSDDLTRLRSFGNRVLTGLVNLLYRTEYTDLCYGYNAFWRRLVPLLDVDRTGFEVETLIALRVASAGLSVTEVPSYERSRGSGVGKLHTFRDGWRVLATIVRERVRPSRRARCYDNFVLPATPAIDAVNHGRVASSPSPGPRRGPVLSARSRLRLQASPAQSPGQALTFSVRGPDRVGVTRATASGRGPRPRARAATARRSRR
jgi:hypothetical protein